MKTYGLIGKTLSHSFSAEYFKLKFSTLGIQADYQLFELENIHCLPELILNNPSLCGLNVTIPFKQAVIPYIDFLSGEAKSVGAVNTIYIVRQNKSLILHGFNTDVIGFEKSLLPCLSGRNKIEALILGTGGSSRAVVFVLKKLNIPYLLVSRNPKPSYSIGYYDLDEQIIRSHQLIINTTPSGMYPKGDDCPLIPYQYINNSHILFDLIYNPPETKFLQLGLFRGAAVQNGLAMLQFQAEASWELWNRS